MTLETYLQRLKVTSIKTNMPFFFAHLETAYFFPDFWVPFLCLRATTVHVWAGSSTLRQEEATAKAEGKDRIDGDGCGRGFTTCRGRFFNGFNLKAVQTVCCFNQIHPNTNVFSLIGNSDFS